MTSGVFFASAKIKKRHPTSYTSDQSECGRLFSTIHP